VNARKCCGAFESAASQEFAQITLDNVSGSSALAPRMAIPSRHDNPFATCWIKPGAIPFRFDENQSAESLVVNLASHSWQGAIIGPHGSGKSTLLESLKPALRTARCRILSTKTRYDQRRLPSEFWNQLHEATARLKCDWPCASAATLPADNMRVLAVIDGFEQLAWLERTRIQRFCRRHGIGLLVTSHRSLGLPTLIRLSPDRTIIDRLVADLCEEVSTGVTAADVAESHACHGSNVREIFFDLYNRHERRRRFEIRSTR
jgi:hypothetical protein